MYVLEEVVQVNAKVVGLHHEEHQVDLVVEQGETLLKFLDHTRLVEVPIAEADRVDDDELVMVGLTASRFAKSLV